MLGQRESISYIRQIHMPPWDFCIYIGFPNLSGGGVRSLHVRLHVDQYFSVILLLESGCLIWQDFLLI